MTFAFIVRRNLEKFCFEWRIRRRVQTWTTFQQIYIRLMKSDSSRSCTRSVHTKALLLQSLWLLFSFNLCLCMSIKHSLRIKQPVEVSLRGRPCHRILTILPINTCTSCSDWAPYVVGFFFISVFSFKNVLPCCIESVLTFSVYFSDTQHQKQGAPTQNHADTIWWPRHVNVRRLIEKKIHQMQIRDMQKHKN